MARTSVIAAVSMALLTLASVPAVHAQVRTTVVVQSGGPAYHPTAPVRVQYVPPPPPRYEATPRARRGMVWVPGHWQARGKGHAWKPGHWVQARQGQHYRAPHWEERNGRWAMQPGRWDRDGDGVPNRYDHRPNDPYRR